MGDSHAIPTLATSSAARVSMSTVRSTGGFMDSPVRAVPLFLVAASVASLLCIASPGEGIPLYAARQGLKCQNCHFDPNGGGPRNEFGFAYARNRHSTEAETQGAFKDLNLVNKVSDSFPLYLGVNQRLMSLADDAGGNIPGLDRFGFYSMETAIQDRKSVV